MAGLIAYGTHIPHHRLRRSAISDALGGVAAAGTRSVASYDEDATSMGVEAARRAVRHLPAQTRPRRLLFATATPPYLEKTNANVVHAVLQLESDVLSIDVMGSVRSGVAALVLASESPMPTLAILTDIRTGLPGGSDERDGGDGAAAFVFGESGAAIADVLAHASTTEEFLDRWRVPGAPAARQWEERFGEHVYGPLADAAFSDALKQAGLTPSQVDVLVVAGSHTRAVRAFARNAGVEHVADDLTTRIGGAATAQPGLLLADSLDRATPGQVIVLVVLADGATTVVLRATEAISAGRSIPTVAAQVQAGDDSLAYATFLTWRGALIREPARRPDPTPPAAPPSMRTRSYKFGFVAHRCTRCGTVHLPAVRICIECRSLDMMERLPMADAVGTLATFTVDHLAFSPSPPVVSAVIDFDGGGRFSCELTDVNPDDVAIGDRVEMTFRRILTAGGIHNYFWKARPVAGGKA